MSDAFLFLHLLSAAAIFAGIVAVSAAVLGAQLGGGASRAFIALAQVGILGVLLFGVALAIDIDGYEPWDVWVLIAIALWLVAGRTGDIVAAHFREPAGEGAAVPSEIARAHWIHVAVVLLLLADMVWKPWA